MTGTRLWMCALLLAVVAVSGVWVLAGDDDDPPKQDDRRRSTVERDHHGDDNRPGDGRRRDPDRRRERGRDRSRGEDNAVTDDRPSDDDPDGRHFGRTVKLDFTLIGEEEPSFIILCAANDYLISHDIVEPNFDHTLEIGGEVHPTDDPDRVFLTFKAMNHHADQNEGIEATFKAEGSASLKVGKETTLANLGAERLTVTATVQE